MRLEIRVQPGAKAESVGGTFNGALVVRVCQPAEKGRATAAALRAVARALGTRGHAVRLVSGRTSRRKVLEIETSAQDQDAIACRIGELRHAGGGEGRGAHAGQLERP
ncbi:MAG: DUF167 domain-containing protein [Actinomycetota bacterium]|nr:DUF167 domain-containing protein [Actinomycetota bacterium]